MLHRKHSFNSKTDNEKLLQQSVTIQTNKTLFVGKIKEIPYSLNIVARKEARPK